MRRAALAQVDLDRVRRPRAPGRSRTTTKSTANRPSTPSLASRAPIVARLAADRPRVAEVGREPAAKVALAARSAEQLVMRRKQLDLAERRHPQLDAGAAKLGAVQTLLDDAAALVPASLGRPHTDSGCSNAIASTRRRSCAELIGGAVEPGRPRRSTSALPSPGDPLVELDDRVGHARPGRAHVSERRHDVVQIAHVLIAERVRDAVLREQPPAAGLRAERRAGADRRRTCGMPSVSARSRSSVVVCVRAQGGSATRSGISARISAKSRGRSSSFCASGRGEPSCAATRCSRARAWLGMTPGSSAR